MIIVKKDFAYKVKYYAHRKLHGSMRDHYGKLGRYLEALKKAFPNIDVDLEVDLESFKHNNKGPLVFKRLYLCFDGLRKGWMQGCKKIICVDACFLKTFLGGQLMSAVGRDGNYQMYPIAWAVVQGENNDSWEWFLTHLQKSISLADRAGCVIVLDEHQSIIRGVSEVLPRAEHRYCARHIFTMWHKNFKGDAYKLMFRSCAKSYSEADYNEALEKLRKADPLAAEALKSYNPSLFCREFMKTEMKGKTLDLYVGDIRAALMKRLVTKGVEMMKWKTDVCPRIAKKLLIEKEEAAMCDVIPSTATVFQVNYRLDTLKVDLSARTCTCRKWDMTGVPCCHMTVRRVGRIEIPPQSVRYPGPIGITEDHIANAPEGFRQAQESLPEIFEPTGLDSFFSIPKRRLMPRSSELGLSGFSVVKSSSPSSTKSQSRNILNPGSRFPSWTKGSGNS
ncbi:uncharacterized protein LOC110713287 [Chenopodium quinoa]|uniref:uncharacterized protein LOC110713287 n=1 Tax=Chenopodium quinoa TaxID=63459 RepID=UPI000B77EE16|nr:uncharacterized protein LOC110713287 [Chenopodium quinoa]